MNAKPTPNPEASDSVLGQTVQRLDAAHGPRPPHRSPIAGGGERRGQQQVERAGERLKASAAPGFTESPSWSASSLDAHDEAIESHADRSAARLAGLERRLRQAAELADFLKQRMTDLDRREAQLNAREAAVEQRERMTQLWVEEKTREVNETRLELYGEIQEFAAERQQFQESQLAWRKRHEAAESELLASSQRLNRDRTSFEAMCRQVQREHDTARLRIQSAERRTVKREEACREEFDQLRRACELLRDHSRQFRREATEVQDLRQQLATRLAKLQDYLDYRVEQLQHQQQENEREVHQRQRLLDARERDIAVQLERMIQERTELMTDRLAVQQLWTQTCAASERARAEQQLIFLRMQVHDQFQRQYRELRALQSAVERQTLQLRWEQGRAAAMRS